MSEEREKSVVFVTVEAHDEHYSILGRERGRRRRKGAEPLSDCSRSANPQPFFPSANFVFIISRSYINLPGVFGYFFNNVYVSLKRAALVFAVMEAAAPGTLREADFPWWGGAS
jgi:hypothetical protein